MTIPIKPSKGTWIPDEIRKLGLGNNRANLLAVIAYQMNEDGVCSLTNDWLADKLEFTDKTIQRMLRDLEEEGFIDISYEAQNVRYLSETPALEDLRKLTNLNGNQQSLTRQNVEAKPDILSGSSIEVKNNLNKFKSDEVSGKPRLMRRKKTAQKPKPPRSSLSRSQKLRRSKLVNDGETKNTLPDKDVRVPRHVRYMIQFWNNQCDQIYRCPKILHEKHGGKQTKNFKKTVMACKQFLDGTLYSPVGLGILPERMRDDRTECEKPYSYSEFETFVKRFKLVLLDGSVKPQKKHFIRQNSSLYDFLVGSQFGNFPAHLLRHCFTEPEPVYESKHEDLHQSVIKMWRKKIRSDFEPTARDIENIDRFVDWYIKYVNRWVDKIGPHIYQIFGEFLSKTWKSKKPSTGYLPSHHCAEAYKEWCKEEKVFAFKKKIKAEDRVR